MRARWCVLISPRAWRCWPAPDVEVIVLVSRGPMNVVTPVVMDDPSTWRAIPDEQLRIVLARRDGRWASAVRAGSYITIDDCGLELIRSGCNAWSVRRWTRCTGWSPARISAVNVPLDDMRAAVASMRRPALGRGKLAALRALGLRGAALAELGAALEEPQAEAVVYARAHVDTDTVWSRNGAELA